MRPALTTFLIVGLLVSCGHAECRYFRTSVKLLTCVPADAKELEASDPYPAAHDVPELEDPTPQSLIKVRCECAYSLQGSDQRCDVDQTIERASVLGADDKTHSCRRGQALCRDVCPSNLP